MVGAVIRRFAPVAVMLGIALWASPAPAQTGQIKGKVVDAKNQPIEGAVVVIEMTEGMTRKHEVKTNRRGEFIQIGLTPGQYKVTASKDGMSQSFPQRIGLDMSEVNFTLKPGSTADISDEERKKAEELFKQGERDAARILKAMRKEIEKEPIAKIDYLAITDTEQLDPLDDLTEKNALVSVAAAFGKARLIDNTILNDEKFRAKTARLKLG